MRIIKIENLEHKPKRFYCKNCTALFEAEPDEYILMQDYYFRDKKERFRCYCPNCGSAVYRLTYNVSDDLLKYISMN